MARRSKGRRRGSRPWKPGVRSLTSAAPKPKKKASWPGATTYQRSLLPEERYTPKGDPAHLNGDWLTGEQFRMVREAIAKRVP